MAIQGALRLVEYVNTSKYDEAEASAFAQKRETEIQKNVMNFWLSFFLSFFSFFFFSFLTFFLCPFPTISLPSLLQGFFLLSCYALFHPHSLFLSLYRLIVFFKEKIIYCLFFQVSEQSEDHRKRMAAYRAQRDEERRQKRARLKVLAPQPQSREVIFSSADSSAATISSPPVELPILAYPSAQMTLHQLPISTDTGVNAQSVADAHHQNYDQVSLQPLMAHLTETPIVSSLSPSIIPAYTRESHIFPAPRHSDPSDALADGMSYRATAEEQREEELLDNVELPRRNSALFVSSGMKWEEDLRSCTHWSIMCIYFWIW